MAKKILIVDDEPDILRAVKVRLVSFGYDVITAANGQDALAVVNKEAPDLILLDLRLPCINGNEVCIRLKGDAKFKHIPIVIFTASSDVGAGNLIKTSGADGYLIKPFNPAELLKTIRKFTG